MKEKVLYIYLPINLYSVAHFYKDELWGTSPSAFNDPFDSLVYIDQERIGLRCDEIYEKTLKNTDETIVGFKKKCLAVINEVFSEARDNFVVSCFTTKNDSEIMWAHYGNKGTGFVLEYSIDEIKRCIDEYYTHYLEKEHFSSIDFIKAVIYSNDYVDATEWALDVLSYSIEKELFPLHGKTESSYEEMECDTKRISLEMLLHKNPCWSYEDEWRAFVVNFNRDAKTKQHFKIGNCKPLSVYLGARISADDEAFLSRIAKEKRIPIYKMQEKVVDKKYRLVKEKIYDEERVNGSVFWNKQ